MQRTQLDGATQFFFWWNFFAGKIMEIGRQPPVPNPSSFYFSGVWGPRNPSLKKWENLPINYPPLPLSRPVTCCCFLDRLSKRNSLGLGLGQLTNPPLRFWIFPRRISLPPIFPLGEIPFPPGDIPIPQEGNRPRAPIPPGTKCWFAGFIFCFERTNALSDYDLKTARRMGRKDGKFGFEHFENGKCEGT